MPRTILVVDDSPIERTVLTSFLKDEYNVLTAESGKEMISILRSRAKAISAILLDIIMPEMDGFEALRKIRENAIYRQIPVIIATGLMDEESQVKAMSLGANGYVIKPFNQTLLKYTLQNTIELREKSALVNTFKKDALTGLPNREFFFKTAGDMIAREEPGHYVLSCFDIENFKVINDQYGIDAGDEVLRHIAEVLKDGVNALGGACCRYSADKFGVLYPVQYKDSDEIRAIHRQLSEANVIKHSFKIRVGRYLVDDLSVPVSAMYDRATLAEESIRGNYDTYIAEYTDSMRQRLLNEQHIVNDMYRALAEGEFEPWLQPQYNHLTGALIGAEALVRWRKDGALVPPSEFVPVFERNGFIYEMDQYIWDKVCALLRRWLDEGREPLPLSVNISRKDLMHAHFIQTFLDIVQKYDIPYRLLRLEVTESAFSESSGQIVERVDELIAMGFTVEIDDFGSGYSSLNTLKDVAATVLKLDMRFFENTKNLQRGGNIVESMVRMAKWLGMSVIAEGVEQKEQADYLKSIGCYYIQGYYYAKPMPVSEYESLMDGCEGEPELARLQTLKTLNNNEFWNPKSMETLIFNSYVGGACIFEYHDGRVELLRVNEQYAVELGQMTTGRTLSEQGLIKYLDEHNADKMFQALQRAIDTEREASCELKLRDDSSVLPNVEYLRVTGRVIARADDRYLFYCVLQNITELYTAEKVALKASERVTAIMDNSQCGITAAAMDDNGKVEYLFVNNRYYEMLGYTREQFEAETRDLFDGVYPEDRQRVVDRAAKLRRVGQTYTQQFRAVRRDGRVIWLRCDTSVVRFADERRVVQLNNLLDITEQLENEKKRLDSARRLEIIMNNVSGGVSALQIFDDGTSNFVFNNERYYELYGYTRAQAMAAKLDVMKTILPEDLPGVMEKVKKLKADRIPTVIDYRAVKRDGSLVYLRANSSMMYMEDYGDVVTSVVTDITEQRELSEKFQAVVENINGGVSATHLRAGEPKFVIVNDQYFRLIGYTREQLEAQNIKLFDLVHPDDRERVKRQFKEAGTHLGRYTMEYRIIRGDGEVRNILCNTNVIRLFGVEEPVQLAVTNDITELRQAQQKERAVSKQLQTLVDNIHGGVTASIAHARDGVEVVFANEGFNELMGIGHEKLHEIFGNDTLAGVHPENRAVVSDAGEYVWLTLYGRMTKDASGNVHLNVCYSDTNKQVSEEQKQKDLLDNLPCGAGLYDLDGEKLSVVHVNKRYQELVGRDVNDHKGASAIDFIYPDDQGRVKKLMQSGVEGGARDATCDVRIRHADGAYHAYRVNCRVIGRKNGKCSCYATFLPISRDQLSMQQMIPSIFPALMEASTDIAFAKDKDFRYLCCSHAYARVLGLGDEKSVVGKTDYELFGSDIADQFRRDDLALVESGKPMIDKMETIPSESGLPCYTRVSKYVLKDTLGNVLGIYGIGRDITQRQETSDQLELLTNSVPGGLATFRCTADENRLEYFNDGFCRLFGYARDELAALTMEQVMAFIFAEDRPEVDAQIAALVCNGTRIDCVYRVHTKDGGYKWINHKATVVNRVQSAAIVNALFLDVTEQQEEKERLRVSEELNRLAIGHSGNIITRFDVENRTLTLPDSFDPIFVLPHVLYNMPDEQIALGRVSPDTAPIYTELFESIVRGEPTGTATYKQNSSKGWRWLEAQFTTVFSSTGKPVSAVISFTDVTEKLEKEVVYNKWQQSLTERPEESYALFRCNLSSGASFESWEGKLLNARFDDAKNTFEERTREYAEQRVMKQDREKYIAFLDRETLLAEYGRGHRSDTLEYRELGPSDAVRWLRLSVDLVEYPSSKDVEAYLLYEDIDQQKRVDLLTLQRSETDPLTGILNRSTFIARMNDILQNSRKGEKHALMMLDVDDFKRVNDTLGHGAGDSVLKDLTARIGAILRRDDLIGRLGGDEFFVFLKGIPSREAAIAKAERICEIQTSAGGADVAVTASIGIAMIPEDGTDFETLYHKVDRALYRQKAQGKDGFTFAEGPDA